MFRIRKVKGRLPHKRTDQSGINGFPKVGEAIELVIKLLRRSQRNELAKALLYKLGTNQTDFDEVSASVFKTHWLVSWSLKSSRDTPA